MCIGVCNLVGETDPPARTNGFVFVRIQGGFHEIRNSVRKKENIRSF